MDANTAGLIATAVKDIVLPEVLAFVRGHHAANGTFPTNETVLANLQLDAARYLAVGQAFLDRTKEQ